MAKFDDSLVGVFVGLLVFVEFGEDCTDVENCACRIALESTKIHLELEICCIHIHQLLHIDSFFFIFLES